MLRGIPVEPRQEAQTDRQVHGFPRHSAADFVPSTGPSSSTTTLRPAPSRILPRLTTLHLSSPGHLALGRRN
jgi:hypothetical protein